MNKKLHLSIAQPCHENWDGMTQTEKGKFCGSCQKQVVDFSKMGDNQIAEFFKKPTTGSVCGRFMSDQLEHAYEIPKKRIPWLKYFFQMALPFLFLSKASAQQPKMGKVAYTKGDTTKIHINDERPTMGMVAPCIKPFVKDTIIEKPVTKTINKKIIKDTSDQSYQLISSPGFVMGGIGFTIDTVQTDEIIQRDIPVPAERNKIYIYPNPVLPGGEITVGVHMLEEGYYQYQVLDLSGKLINQKEIWIDAETRLMNMEAPKMAAGSYLFTLTNKKSGKKYSEKIIIQ